MDYRRTSIMLKKYATAQNASTSFDRNTTGNGGDSGDVLLELLHKLRHRPVVVSEAALQFQAGFDFR